MRIDQFHSGSAYGDAITNGMLYLQKLLRSAGIDGDVYAEHIDPKIAGKIKPLSQLRPDKSATLIYHHSLGHDRLDDVLALPQRKALIYHNITPPEFFANVPFMAAYAKKGLDQLEAVCKACDVLLADSSFNGEGLKPFTGKPVAVVPVLVDLASRAQQEVTFDRLDELQSVRNILTVGRIAPNKGHLELVQAAKALRDRQVPGLTFKWRVVGSYGESDPYYAAVRRAIADADLEDIIDIVGHVSDSDLAGYYRTADVLAVLSNHEGFCVPIVEAFINDLPVVARDVGAISETLNGGGVLLSPQAGADDVADALAPLLTGREGRRNVIASQRTARLRYDTPKIYDALRAALAPIAAIPAGDLETAFEGERPMTVRGPFFGSYSLSIVNRNLADGLEANFGTATERQLTEGGGDFQPTADDTKTMPALAAAVEKPVKIQSRRWVIDNMWPPRPIDARGLYQASYFFWEESLVPDWIIQRFNTHLDAVFCPSHFVAKALRDSGYAGPTPVVGCAIDTALRAKIEAGEAGKKPAFGDYIPKDAKLLLHVSSAFPRKGIDTLLAAYRREFTITDDIVLYIKTFRNPHNEIDRLWAENGFNLPDAPQLIVDHDERDLDEMLWLQRRADAIVTFSRGEGYGFPVGEAIGLNKTVIFPRHSALADFPQTEREINVPWTYEQARSHLNQSGSVWSTVAEADARRALKEAVAAAGKPTRGKTAATHGLAKLPSWGDVGREIAQAAKAVEAKPAPSPRHNVAWMSTYGSRCGISDYSISYLDEAPNNAVDPLVLTNKDKRETRDLHAPFRITWSDHLDGDMTPTFTEVMNSGCKSVVIQFNHGFFSMQPLERLVKAFHAQQIATVIELHAIEVRGEESPAARLKSAPDLWKCIDRVLVHNPADLNLMREFVDAEKLSLLPVLSFDSFPRDLEGVRSALALEDHRPILATYGFFLPNKGLDAAIDVLKLVRERYRNALLLMINAEYPNPVSRQEIERIESIILDRGVEPNVIMVTDYLSHEESVLLLQAADVIMLPNRPTRESASSSIRRALSAARPILASREAIFDEFKQVVAMEDIGDVAAFAETAMSIYEHPREQTRLLNQQQAWVAANHPAILARRLYGMVAGLAAERAGARKGSE
jgi:glycosyltransferase involved in cell wall biosynthesis